MPRNSVRDQYETHPYPPLHWAALPHARQLLSLSLSQYRESRAPAPRILVLGCGTLEPLLVAEQNRDAAQITAVDLSAASLEVLRKRSRLYRIATFLNRRPGVEFVCADFMEWGNRSLGEWDYVIASNVLHHLEDPVRGLARCSQFLKPGGILRMVTYPKLSRIWMRAGSDYFRAHGMTGRERDLRARCAQVILQLPLTHPVRSAYRASSEILTRTGLVDAYFHAQENPLSPMEWARAAATSGLTFHGEWPVAARADDHSRTLDAWLPELLDSPARDQQWLPLWKLDVLDSLLELGSNPVLTWVKQPPSDSQRVPAIDPTPAPRAVGDLSSALERVNLLLAYPGILSRAVSTHTLLSRARTQSAPPRYAGLRLQDYPEIWS